MSLVYRVLRKKYATSAFDGEGAYHYGGRWSSPGVRLSYTSEHQSLALLEYFVHLDKDDPPADLVLAIADIPDELTREPVAISQLPRNWRDPAAPAELARIGDAFVKQGDHCVLIVPSALAPHEHNWLLNPEHPEFRRAVVRQPEPLAYDPRMFEKPGPRRKR